MQVQVIGRETSFTRSCTSQVHDVTMSVMLPTWHRQVWFKSIAVICQCTVRRFITTRKAAPRAELAVSRFTSLATRQLASHWVTYLNTHCFMGYHCGKLKSLVEVRVLAAVQD